MDCRTQETPKGKEMFRLDGGRPVAGTALPVLLLGGAPAPTPYPAYPLYCAPEPVLLPEHLTYQLCAALRRAPTVVVVGGFYGDAWPLMTALCGAIAYATGVPESEVLFRWVNEGVNALGAQFNARNMTVYVVPNDQLLAPRMLYYIGKRMAEQAQAQLRATAPAAPTAPARPPPVPQQKPAEKPVRRRKAARPSSAGKSVIAVLVVIATLAALGSGGWLINYALEEGRQQRANEDIASRFHDGADSVSYGGGGMLERFAALYEENSDIIGWLTIPAAGVDLPVMRANDDTYYLTHDFARNTTRYGALFLAARDQIGPGQNSANLSIFGHNTRNGTMFGQLKKFREPAFCKENPTFQFSTLYREAEWVVFAVMVVNIKGSFFDWREPDPRSPAQMEDFLQEIRSRSIVDCGVEVDGGDRLLSLATCCYDYKDARLVVFARELRPGEVMK